MATWVLVANRVSARIFARDGRRLGLVENIEFPSGRGRDESIEGGSSHRTFDSHARGRQQNTSPHEHAAHDFAKELAGELRRGRTDHAVERIILVAEPHFLGLLRAALDEATRALIVASVPKDIAEADLEVIQDHVFDAYWAP